ncbi:MAG: hypothetical protein OEM63_00905, partial [Gammaproteobacteria bacterium]|nr:hypothetical protein [Gammaproteobacteria bacterium]
MSFFSELKRRNVIRVALLYLVASWLLLQVADVGISLLGIPDWAGRFVFLLLLMGFPLVMVFSWAYEITPEGVKREKDVPREQSITDETARKLNTAVIVLLLVSLGTLGLDRLIPEQVAAPQQSAEAVTDESVPTAASAPEQSIAVLPFVNMSADVDNEYFSDGLSEELLNLLAKIPELQVAARTSTFSFKGSDAGIPEIAEKLNVAHVLEGSVRKSGQDIRITAQLIKASDGYHLWSHAWDRRLVDVFAIQDEIAAAVVDALKVSLLGELPRARATDVEAYELYLQARAAHNYYTQAGFEEAAQLLTRALAIDPEYAEAWVELGRVRTNQVGQNFLSGSEGFPAARAAAERALQIDPTLARAMSNLGWITMYSDWDFAEASRLIERALRLEPGNASVLNAYAVLNGAFGRREAMIGYYNEALVVDPVAMSVLGNLAGAYLASDTMQTRSIVERMREVQPESMAVPVFTGFAEQADGNAEVALELFNELDGVFSAWGRALTHWDLGRDEESDTAIEEMYTLGADPVQVASVYAYRDDHDKTFEWLERGYMEHDDSLIEVRMYQQFQN